MSIWISWTTSASPERCVTDPGTSAEKVTANFHDVGIGFHASWTPSSIAAPETLIQLARLCLFRALSVRQHHFLQVLKRIVTLVS